VALGATQFSSPKEGDIPFTGKIKPIFLVVSVLFQSHL